VLVQLVAGIMLVAGLLVRNEYTESLFPRILVSVGVVAMIVLELLPAGGEIPLVHLFKALIDAPGKEKIVPLLELGQVVLVVLAVLVWMPGPASAGAKLFAWLLLLYPVFVHFVELALQDNFVDLAKAAPFTSLAAWVPEVTISVFICYGLATVFGKQLE
jgi:hypothetical protein